MGYTTLRNIHIETGDHSPHEISQAFSSQFDSSITGLYVYVSPIASKNGVLDFDGVTPRSWYSEEEDLKKFSMRFPSATIVVSGEGESSNDKWKHVYQAGRFWCRTVVASWGDWEEQ